MKIKLKSNVPECNNIIELDWSGELDDEIQGCHGECPSCSGCNGKEEDDESEDNEDDM